MVDSQSVDVPSLDTQPTDEPASTPTRPLMILVDGHAVAYRQFFALPLESFSTREGEPTNATFGFTRILMDILEKDKPTYLAVSFDMGLSGRETWYDQYKGTRDKMPDDLDRQITRIMQMVEAFNIPVLALDGYEADDVIGTVTQQAVAEGVHVRVITGDRDLLQLLRDEVEIQLPSRGKIPGPDEIFNTARFIEKYEIQPGQLVDFKALVGDTSDNIPGVDGIGDVTATKLLKEYGTLENLYANIDAVKGAVQKKLIAGRESAFLSQRLARIQLDVPINIHLPACVAHEFDTNAVLEMFEQVDFRSLRDRLLRMTAPNTPNMFGEDDFSDGDEGDDFGTSDLDFAPPARADLLIKTVIVRDPAQLTELVETLNRAAMIAFDTETTSTDQMAGELVGIALSTDGETGYYIPVGHKEGRQLPLQVVLDALQAPLTNPAIPKFAHNASYDLVVLRRYGIDVSPITFDTMIAEWLLDPLSKNLGLKNLVFSRLKDDEGRPSS